MATATTSERIIACVFERHEIDDQPTRVGIAIGTAEEVSERNPRLIIFILRMKENESWEMQVESDSRERLLSLDDDLRRRVVQMAQDWIRPKNTAADLLPFLALPSQPTPETEKFSQLELFQS